ncbi:MAG: molecular chaperone HscC [Lachnospiraceae bacterium]|nr:molecular chaperone HscC [Lachnospiraceae bacterium]
MSKIIGIDLGTTNSLAAVWQDGKSVLIPNALGEYLTPSVVSVDARGTVYVGKSAKERLATHPNETASVFKRFMGTSKKYQLGKQTFLPEELSALVLKKLKEDAERFLGEEVEEAIISVPAYFNDMARNATKRAGLIAGWKVERIINEPSAAALACQNVKQVEEATMMVFDFGGGTLDVSLVDCFDNVIEILAISGDNRLGGQDFDDMIAEYFLKEQKVDVSKLDPETIGVVRMCAEQCKRALTESQTAQMTVKCPQINATMEISRKDVVNFCARIFERMGKPIRQVMADGHISVEEISDVVLVGGSCKMPLVQQYLAHVLKRNDIETIDPDHVIALGCGVCAGIKERNEQVKDMLLTDICPFSLGIGVHDNANSGELRMSYMIERNSALPISKQHTFFPHEDYQTLVTLSIYQGESLYAADNLELGKLEIEIPPRLSVQMPICVRFTYDINGILEVEVDIPATKEHKQMVIVNKDLSMTEEQIQAKLREFEKIKISPAKDEKNQYIMDWGSRLYMQCTGELQQEIGRKLEYFRYEVRRDNRSLKRVQKYMMVYLGVVEGMVNQFIKLSENDWKDGSWYQEETEEETQEKREIEDEFRTWEKENYDDSDTD